MAIQLLSIAVLFLIFIVGSWRRINLGVVALVATFAMGALVTHDPLDTMLEGFPANVFVLLLGVTFLFGIATVNGTIDWVVEATAGLLRENRALMPWVLFILAAIPTNVGAAGPVSIALLAPVAMRMARRYAISPLLAGLMVIHGADSGNLSPINILGAIINGTLDSQDLEASSAVLWAGNLGFNLVLAIVCYLLFGGLKLREPVEQAMDASSNDEMASGRGSNPVVGGATGRLTSTRSAPGRVVVKEAVEVGTTTLVLTLTAIVAVAVGALAFSLDIGFLALSAAVLLMILQPKQNNGAFSEVSWSTIALICGVVTYVGFLQHLGTIDMVGSNVAGIAAPLLAAFLLCLIAGVTSAFASSIAILGVLIPLSIPFLTGGDINITALILAMGICATVVDATPFSSIGALTVANAPEEHRERLSRQLVLWGFSMVVVAPVLTWLVIVIPFS